jgi:hypothetical protein
MNLTNIKSLSKGSHKSKAEGACIMELVSLLANEPWSYRPECASDSITTFCIWINDEGDQKHRDKLLVLAPQIVGTKDHRKEAARAKLYAEYASWCKNQAAEYATEFAEYAEYAEYAAKSAKSAKYAEYAAKSAAKSAEYAKSAAEYAKSAAEFAKSAAEFAKSAAEFRVKLYDKAIKCLEKVLAV